jgi:hypothetical protein
MQFAHSAAVICKEMIARERMTGIEEAYSQTRIIRREISELVRAPT